MTPAKREPSVFWLYFDFVASVAALVMTVSAAVTKEWPMAIFFLLAYGIMEEQANREA